MLCERQSLWFTRLLRSISTRVRRKKMRKLVTAALALAAVACTTGTAAASWAVPAGTLNTVVSPPVVGGGYPVPPGSTVPVPGTCGPIALNSNHSESWLAVKPGTETVVGNSKYFVDR